METTETPQIETNVSDATVATAVIVFAVIGGFVGSLTNVGFDKAREKLAERKAQKALEA